MYGICGAIYVHMYIPMARRTRMNAMSGMYYLAPFFGREIIVWRRYAEQIIVMLFIHSFIRYNFDGVSLLSRGFSMFLTSFHHFFFFISISNWISVNLEFALFDGIPSITFFPWIFLFTPMWNVIFLYGFMFVMWKDVFVVGKSENSNEIWWQKGNHTNAHTYFAHMYFG